MLQASFQKEQQYKYLDHQDKQNFNPGVMLGEFSDTKVTKHYSNATWKAL